MSFSVLFRRPVPPDRPGRLAIVLLGTASLWTSSSPRPLPGVLVPRRMCFALAHSNAPRHRLSVSLHAILDPCCRHCCCCSCFFTHSPLTPHTLDQHIYTHIHTHENTFNLQLTRRCEGPVHHSCKLIFSWWTTFV